MSKMVKISDEAYELLKALKPYPRASFDDIIKYLLKKVDISEYGEVESQRVKYMEKVEIEGHLKKLIQENYEISDGKINREIERLKEKLHLLETEIEKDLKRKNQKNSMG